MKSLKIPFISSLNAASIEEAALILTQSNDLFEKIDVLNWPLLFGYTPDTNFKIARSADSIFILYEVVEEHIRAVHTDDQNPVCEDSCVEFFCKLPDQPIYHNFEFNCIGTCLAVAREGRRINKQPYDSERLKQIERYSSLGKQPFGEKNKRTKWQFCAKIPFFLLGINADSLPEKLQANFYKCGDKTQVPHYVSWNPVKTESPDFHRPDFFGEIYF